MIACGGAVVVETARSTLPVLRFVEDKDSPNV
jgi:hypothetical protein